VAAEVDPSVPGPGKRSPAGRVRPRAAAKPSGSAAKAPTAPDRPRVSALRPVAPRAIPTAKTPRPPLGQAGRNLQRVAVVIPAKDEVASIAETVRSARAIPHVDLVLVVDDGSTDGTQDAARDAGGVVVRHSHNRGKSAALETGAAVVAMRDVPGRAPRLLLFLDADLAESAANAAPLVAPVREGVADLAIALQPLQVGGRGIAVGAARDAITALTGWTPTQPLSGIRCLTREAYEAATPLAHGFGVETGMTIDLLRQGYVAVEVPCDLRHRPRTYDLHGQAHRLVKYRDILVAANSRRVKGALVGNRRPPAAPSAPPGPIVRPPT
jgi:hypothetical protein